MKKVKTIRGEKNIARHKVRLDKEKKDKKGTISWSRKGLVKKKKEERGEFKAIQALRGVKGGEAMDW